MKTITKISALITGCLILLIVSCKNDAAGVVDPPGTGSTTGATWRVSLFIDNGDETANFNGYVFTFNANGQVAAVRGTTTKTGTWSETSTRFNLDFGADALFDDLGDNWLIVEKTATTIRLKDDNPANDERLEFVKL